MLVSCLHDVVALVPSTKGGIGAECQGRQGYCTLAKADIAPELKGTECARSIGERDLLGTTALEATPLAVSCGEQLLLVV